MKCDKIQIGSVYDQVVRKNCDKANDILKSKHFERIHEQVKVIHDKVKDGIDEEAVLILYDKIRFQAAIGFCDHDKIKGMLFKKNSGNSWRKRQSQW